MKIRSIVICTSTIAFLAAQAMAAAVTDGVPPRDITDPKSVASQALAGAAPVPIDDLFYTRGGLDAAWLADGKSVVISTNLTGRYNLWTVPTGGGFPLQLTQSDDRQSGLTTSPDGKWVVFQSDHGGAEIYDLYAVPAKGGAVVDLTNTPDIDEQGAVFSPDEDSRLRAAAKSGVLLQHCADGFRHAKDSRAYARGVERLHMGSRHVQP